MAERPDLEYYVPILQQELAGRTITAMDVTKPVVMRVAVEGKAEELLVGRTIEKVTRRAHFVLFALDGGLEIVVAPMLAGRFVIAEGKGKLPGDRAVVWALSDGRRLVYRDDVQMGKVYVIKAGDWAVVPGLVKIGIDARSPTFTREAFRTLAKKRRDQVRVFIMDKQAIDALGNAYADEVLWAARIHPKTLVSKLAPEELDDLHDAIVSVLDEASAVIGERKPPIDEKLRDFVKVRNRHGEPCPRCGTKIRRAGVHGHDTFFCPTCQPETRKSSIVDWRTVNGKTSREE